MTSKCEYTSINLQHRVQAFQLSTMLSQVDAAEFEKLAFSQLRLDELVKDSEPLLLYVPKEWLHIRWDKLHDGYQYLGLQQPVVLTQTELPPPQPLQHGSLRILLTITQLENGNSSDDIIVGKFAERLNRLIPNREWLGIDLTVEREITARKLVDKIKTAEANGKAFHIWHHSGNFRLTPEGIALQLTDGELKPQALQSLVKRRENGETSRLRLFLLHTSSTSLSLLPALTNISVPYVIGLAMGPQSDVLLNGLYLRLLSKDVGTAVFLARLDSYISNRGGDEWTALEILSGTKPICLVADSWRNQFKETIQNNDLPRFLFLRANPVDVRQGMMLPLDREIKRIKEVLSYRRDEFKMRDEGALEIEDFSKFLLEMRPHLLHFSGHGTTRGSLLWETSDSTKTAIQPERIASMIARFEQIQCIILNACYTTQLADSLHFHGIVVIGMTDSVTDDTAVHFARGLYQALAHGETLAQAFDLARDEITLSGAVDETNIPQITDYEAAKRIRFFKKAVV